MLHQAERIRTTYWYVRIMWGLDGSCRPFPTFLFPVDSPPCPGDQQESSCQRGAEGTPAPLRSASDRLHHQGAPSSLQSGSGRNVGSARRSTRGGSGGSFGGKADLAPSPASTAGVFFGPSTPMVYRRDRTVHLSGVSSSGEHCRGSALGAARASGGGSLYGARHR